MTKKINIKQRVSGVLTDDEDKKVRDYTKKHEISINQFLRDAVNLKLNYDKDTEKTDKKYKILIKEYEQRVKQEKYNNWIKKSNYFGGLKEY